MPETSPLLQEKLRALLESADSIKSLSVAVREDLVNKLLALNDEQTIAIIKILEEEKSKVSALNAKLKEYGNKIEDLFGKARQAGRDLKLAFMKAKADDQTQSESDQTENLLRKL